MQGQAPVIDYLKELLRGELAARDQYFLHSRMYADWGFSKLYERINHEMEEETQHADALLQRILFLEGHPNLQRLDPIRTGQDPKETLECDLAAEHEARALYKEVREYCASVGDWVTKELFEELLADEEGHIDFLETQLDLHDRVGAANYAQINASRMDQAE